MRSPLSYSPRGLFYWEVSAIGCTGGRHRSVTVAYALYQHLSGLEEYGLKIEHRDIGR